VLSAGREATSDVSLEEEMEFVRSYLAVEQLRLGERLRVVEDVDPDALELAIPPLLLQPLVENAVRHGVAPRRQGGTIRLHVSIAASSMLVEIADDGNGAEPEGWRRAEGLGLRAVARQLQTRFGRAADLDVATRPQAGFAVRLKLPVRLPARSAA
jgi:LytS/YehU family sensor histidine kinase